MDYVYHGSKISNLKTIEPRISTHQENLVYASTSPCIATIFLNHGGSDLLYALGGKGTLDRPAYLVERLPGVFAKIFSGSGSIYTLDKKEFTHREGFWDAEVVAKGAQKVLKEEKIDHILERLNEYEKKGFCKLYRYPDRPEFIPLDNHDLISKYVQFYQMGHRNSIKELLSLYPEFTEEVQAQLGREKGL